MGFTDFPHARRLDAVTDAWAVIARDGDMAVMHFDDGVPWEEALAGAPYPSAYAEELTARARAIPPGHVRYLAVTPIAFARDRLAPRRRWRGHGAPGSSLGPSPLSTTRRWWPRSRTTASA